MCKGRKGGGVVKVKGERGSVVCVKGGKEGCCVCEGREGVLCV